MTRLDPTGCPWIVRVPSGNPEPDFPSDLWIEQPCGAPLSPDPPDGERCEAGHTFGNLEARLSPFGEEWQREYMERNDPNG